MRVSISEAEQILDELIDRARAGEDVFIIRDGHPVVRFAPVAATVEERRALIARIQASAAKRVTAGPCAARSQDFLYDEDGLPG